MPQAATRTSTSKGATSGTTTLACCKGFSGSVRGTAVIGSECSTQGPTLNRDAEFTDRHAWPLSPHYTCVDNLARKLPKVVASAFRQWVGALSFVPVIESRPYFLRRFCSRANH